MTHSHVNYAWSLWLVSGCHCSLSVLCIPIPFCVVFLLILWYSGTSRSDCVSANKFHFRETQSNLQCTQRCFEQYWWAYTPGPCLWRQSTFGDMLMLKKCPLAAGRSAVLCIGRLWRTRNPEFEALSAKVVWVLSPRPLPAPYPLPLWLLESEKWRATGWGRT